MRVISRARLIEFWEVHPTAEAPLETWRRAVRRANWRTFNDVRATFGNADNVGRCVVFNIGGNSFRLVAAIHYQKQLKDRTWTVGKVFVRGVMTHSGYNQGKWKPDCGAK